MTDDRQVAVDRTGRALQHYQRSVQAFDDAVGRWLGVGPADLRCLDFLSEGPRTAGELAHGAGLRPAATTTLIDRLEARGLVRRTRSTEDRRRVLVAMTEEGAALVWEAYGPMVTEGQGLLDGLDTDELNRMAELLTSMSELTDRHRGRLTPRS